MNTKPCAVVLGARGQDVYRPRPRIPGPTSLRPHAETAGEPFGAAWFSRFAWEKASRNIRCDKQLAAQHGFCGFSSQPERRCADNYNMKPISLHSIALVVVLASGCTTPNPNFRECTANQPLRCDDNTLTSCNGEGTAEVSVACSLGCSATELRCVDPVPSNGLARHLESSSSRADLDLGDAATMNTDTGEVVVAGVPVAVDTDTLVQTGGPSIRVFVVRRLTAKDIAVSGANALAIVSGSDITVSGTLTVSAAGAIPGAGAFNEETCTGKLPPPGKSGGFGGGGFGSVGGPGGRGFGDDAVAGLGGAKVGTTTLTPLRGGCSGAGEGLGRQAGAGGGAVQLVSRNQIIVSGIIAANGGGGSGGGGAGGGILLEAPAVQLVGSVVANGGGGGVGIAEDCVQGQDGRFDTKPAAGGTCKATPGPIILIRPSGGAGAAGDVDAKSGGGVIAVGHGGGGAGRIRVNTAPGGLAATGTFSPNPSLGTISTP